LTEAGTLTVRGGRSVAAGDIDGAVVHVELPAGAAMPEHDHGASQIVLIPVAGSVELRHDGRVRTLTAGAAAAHIAVGERVGLANPGEEPASLVVVASPPAFARRLESWPPAETA
ncbi:cupin domain-containing protein, partial [Streptomyces carpinensis]